MNTLVVMYPTGIVCTYTRLVMRETPAGMEPDSEFECKSRFLRPTPAIIRSMSKCMPLRALHGSVCQRCMWQHVLG